MIRNNILIILGDLASVNASLVDQYTAKISEALCDEKAILRKQTAMTLSSLVSEDYIKFKDSLPLRFIYALSDDNKDVKNFIESVFSKIILKKEPTIFEVSFLNALCVFNGFGGEFFFFFLNLLLLIVA